MKKINLIFASCVTVVLLGCNTQKSVDPTGQGPIPVGSEKPIDGDTTAADDNTADALPDTLMKDSL